MFFRVFNRAATLIVNKSLTAFRLCLSPCSLSNNLILSDDAEVGIISIAVSGNGSVYLTCEDPGGVVGLINGRSGSSSEAI